MTKLYLVCSMSTTAMDYIIDEVLETVYTAEEAQGYAHEFADDNPGTQIVVFSSDYDYFRPVEPEATLTLHQE